MSSEGARITRQGCLVNEPARRMGRAEPLAGLAVQAMSARRWLPMPQSGTIIGLPA